MTAKYKDKLVNVSYVSGNKEYVIAYYEKEDEKMFKIDVKDLTEINTTLKAELTKEDQ